MTCTEEPQLERPQMGKGGANKIRLSFPSYPSELRLESDGYFPSNDVQCGLV